MIKKVIVDPELLLDFIVLEDVVLISLEYAKQLISS